MFQRLKGFNLDSFLDSKIAEEQAKQAQSSKPSSATKRTPSNAPGNARRGSPRTDSPSKQTSSRRPVQDGEQERQTSAPDPDSFVIGDDVSDISRLATPTPAKEASDTPILDQKVEEKPAETDTAERQDVASPSPSDKGKEKEKVGNDQALPEDVQKKLAKLENLTTRYQDLLRNYRTAHARVASIEPFEATLREHTPLTSITDPSALVEFLGQRTLQSEMVMDELKRLSAENRDIVKERDELKVKLEEAETKAKEAFNEAAGLREQRQEQQEKSATDEISQETTAASTTAPEEVAEDTFFDYEAELPQVQQEVGQHQIELQEQQDYINELSTENASLRTDLSETTQTLEATRLDLSAMQNKVSVKEREIAGFLEELRLSRQELETANEARRRILEEGDDASASLVQSEAQMVWYTERLEETQAADKKKLADAEANLTAYKQEHAETIERSAMLERENMEIRQKEKIHQNVVNALRAQLKSATEEKLLAEGRIRDLELEMNRLNSEADSRGDITAAMRSHQDAAATWKKKVEVAEQERDAANRLAETKKGHEAKAASLRAQLKTANTQLATAISERDSAYQMIIDCSKCKLPGKPEQKTLEPPTESSTPLSRSRNDSEATEQTEASTQPTEVTTPSVDGGEQLAAADSKKKKNKKKSKKKKDALSEAEPATQGTTAELELPSAEELRNDPAKLESLLSNVDGQRLPELLKTALNGMMTSRAKEDEEHESLLRHHEQLIEERDVAISNNVRVLKEREEEIAILRHKIAEKEAAIERLDKKLKGEEELREEIEMLKESLMEAGGESTSAKAEAAQLREQQKAFDEQIADLRASSAKDAEAHSQAHKEVLAELQMSHTKSETDLQVLREQLHSADQAKQALEVAKEACEKQIEDLKLQHSANGVELDAKHKELRSDYEQLLTRATTLETDLEAANQLAQARFKDLTDLKEHLNTVQPELKKLRQEAEELKKMKVELEKANESVKMLEAREKDLRSEIAEYKAQAEKRDAEVESLKGRAKASDERSTALEDTCERARKDLEANERTRDEAVEARDRLQTELTKAQEDLRSARVKLDEIEVQANKFRDEARTAKEELQLLSKQRASAQGLMDSMTDQTRELATQMKEIKERNEGLQEELADAHRLLSERGREGETMRRLLSDVESRADAKVKEMRERLDLAIEERDRAEDEASTVGRRKAREVEELKTKVRDIERDAARAKEAKEDAERREKEFRNRQEELELKASRAQQEAAEVRTAMANLQDAWEEAERQSRELEKEQAELRETLEEREARLERLQKSSKSMAEELRNLQSANKARQPSASVQSSRSSIESSRVMSPVSGRGSNGAPIGGGQQVDYVYLKNVLLQFLEQKEKKHQMQLVPVLGMLLHFDAQDMEKWNHAIAAR